MELLSKKKAVMPPVLFSDIFLYFCDCMPCFSRGWANRDTTSVSSGGPSRRLSWTQFVKMVRIDSRRSLVTDFKLLLSRLGLPHDPLVPSR